MSGVAHIVYIEDNPGDVELIRQSLDTDKVTLTVLEDGKEAMRYFERQVKENNVNIQLIILDINIPFYSGFEILTHIKSSLKLRGIPSVIFSTSANPDDIEKSYAHCANGYLVKSINMEDFRKKLHVMIDYWINVNALPN